MEERVRRLRAAHLAAKQHSVSRMDQVIGSSRRLFDAAHKFTVMGLIGFSGIALLVTVYATADMMMYNRKRRNEFFALQKQLKEDSLEAARLAYMTGTASEEQIALVEDATAKAKEAGITLPSILSTPQTAAPAGGRESEDPLSHTTTTTEPENEKKGGITRWLFGGLKKEEDTDHWGDTSTPTTGDIAGSLRDKAQAAFEQERDSQQRGGPLDQVGVDAGEGKKKGWLW
ncbi:cytochrome oxidase c assembly-domain-containing protein [Xylaria digitata]|nr:cytochrome oxidase c assembly-domain-containing protein [Xylaria digitata]